MSWHFYSIDVADDYIHFGDHFNPGKSSVDQFINFLSRIWHFRHQTVHLCSPWNTPHTHKNNVTTRLVIIVYKITSWWVTCHQIFSFPLIIGFNLKPLMMKGLNGKENEQSCKSRKKCLSIALYLLVTYDKNTCQVLYRTFRGRFLYQACG